MNSHGGGEEEWWAKKRERHAENWENKVDVVNVGRGEMKCESRPEFIINDITRLLDLLTCLTWLWEPVRQLRWMLNTSSYTRCPLPPIPLPSHNRSLCSLLPGHSTDHNHKSCRLSIKKKSCTYKPELAGSQWPAYSSGAPLRTCCSPVAANRWSRQKQRRVQAV